MMWVAFVGGSISQHFRQTKSLLDFRLGKQRSTLETFVGVLLENG
jgi:hypothetical protein